MSGAISRLVGQGDTTKLVWGKLQISPCGWSEDCYQSSTWLSTPTAAKRQGGRCILPHSSKRPTEAHSSTGPSKRGPGDEHEGPPKRQKALECPNTRLLIREY